MNNNRELRMPYQVFGTIGSPIRFFLAGYVLDRETPLTTSQMNLTIEENYPQIYKEFFAGRSKNYAFCLARKSLQSLGVAERMDVEIEHQTHGHMNASAFRSTDLVEGIENYVHYWWRMEIEHRVPASHYLAHLSGPTLEGPYNREAILSVLSENDSLSVKELDEAMTSLSLPFLNPERVKEGEDMLGYSKLYRHLANLAALRAVELTDGDTARTKYSAARATITEEGRKLGEIFVKPIFEVLKQRGMTKMDTDVFE